MPAVTTVDLNNAKLNLDHLEALLTSPALTAVDRLGNVKMTWSGLLADLNAAAAITETGTNREQAQAARDAALVAQAAAELAEDSSWALSRLRPSTAAGLADATIPNGEYFGVLSAEDTAVADIYLKVDGATATFSGKRSISSNAALKPKWAGKIQAWPDPFFRDPGYLTTNTLLGATRWWTASGNYANWATAANTLFDGKMLIKTGNADLSGMIIDLAEAGIAVGDTMTASILVTGAGATAQLFGRFALADGTWVGGQLPQGLTDTGAGGAVTSGTPQRLTIEAVVPATATHLRLYPVASAAGVSFNVNALWSYKGAKTAGPSWPIMPDPDGLRAKVTKNTADIATNAAAIAPVVQGAGRKNGWPDPFFRNFDIASITQYGRVRWSGSTPNAFFTKVANAVFNGYALRRNAGLGSGSLGGVRVWMDDLGAVAGDTISVYHLFVADGTVTINAPAGFYTSAGAAVGGQLAGVAQVGGGSQLVNQGTTPRWIKQEVVVPATAAYLWIYPWTGTAAKTFDVVAVWAFKGTAAGGNGPTWPTLEDPSNFQLQINDLDTRLDVAEPKITLNTALSTYAVDSRGAVTASAEAVTLAVVNPSTAARDLTFRGWGEPYVPAGVSFNAVRIKTISRTAALESSKWRTLSIMVRTGAGSHLGTAPVVAVGSITVLEDSDVLNNVTILLKDPVTGAPKTLSDADFSGGEYFIGVYATNAAGAPAACGEPRATQPNHLGALGYYTTAANPLTANWLAVTGGGGPRQGFEHLLLTAPVESTVYSPTPEMSAGVLATLAESAPSIVKPPFIYGVQGKECNVYIRALHYGDESEYFHDFAGSYGTHQNERWTYTPTGALAANPLTYSAHNKRTGSQLVSHVMQLRTAAVAAGAGNQAMMFIGDSLINGGIITQTMLDNAATDVMGVTLYGTRGTGANKHEGRGGWSIDDYATAGHTYYSFTVSGVVTPPAINSTTYTNNGNIYTVQEVNLVGGAGTIVCSVSPLNGAPQAAGVLTKTFGVGDAAINYSAFTTVPGNPFWIGGALNFSQYLANNGYPVMKKVFICLGVNDGFSQTTDAGIEAKADSELAKLDLLIASIKASDPGTKVFPMLTSPGGDQDAFGNNYGVSQNWHRYKRNMAIWSSKLITKYGAEEANRIILVPCNVAWDSVYSQSTVAAARNARDATVVNRQNNGVHPATIGYQQIGDCCWATAKVHA